MVKQPNTPERMLSDDERALLDLWPADLPVTAGDVPIHEDASGFTWEYRSLHAPRPYVTRAEAVEAFQNYRMMLLESARAEREQTYAVKRPETEGMRLLSAAMTAKGMSVREFARDVLVREPRTVWRWLSGENAIPASVRELCASIVSDAPDPDPRIAGRAAALSGEDFARVSRDGDKLVLAFPHPKQTDRAAYKITVHQKWAAQHLALANAALRDDDPRKITRQMVDLLRGIGARPIDEADRYAAIANALEAFLPPDVMPGDISVRAGS